MNYFRFLLCVLLLVMPSSLFAADLLIQDLSVRIFPQEQRLQAEVKLTRSSDDMGWPNVYLLAHRADVTSVLVDGKPSAYDFDDGSLKLKIASNVKVLLLKYSVVFDDLVPADIVGIEDPSYGVAATIQLEGAYLSSAANWHPRAVGVSNLFKVSITGPNGMTGVTAGRLESYEQQQAFTRTVWRSRLPHESLTLAAGELQLSQEQLGKIQLLVFVSEANSKLAAAYLESIRKYLQIYRELFGPYPYEKFAVVENFYPTGYGLPGWTLLGSRVVRLPFIRTTSLPHEIAHAWWGNSVEIDYANGNWGEGLATYVADYYLKELEDEKEAHEYRRKLVRDYASLVTSGNDMPLVDFRRRMSKPDQAIGYGKAAMVFHMLRKQVGDEIFWQALQSIAREGRGKRFGWVDLRSHFENAAQEDLQTFFSQWLERSGAPTLSLSDIDVIRVGSNWQVSGNVHQEKPVYDLAVPLLLETEGRQYEQVVGLYNETDCFVFTVADRPLRLSLDAGSDLFRHLYLEEQPATINDLRASQSQIVVVAKGQDALLQSSKDLLRGLQWHKAPVLSEAEFLDVNPTRSDVLFLGQPDDKTLQPEIRAVPRQEYDNPDNIETGNNVLFRVNSRYPGGPVVAYFLPGSVAAAQDTARRIPHYGRYSYLAFRAGKNILKGTWEAGESPLKVDLTKDTQ